MNMAPPSGLPSTMRAAQWRSIAGGIEKNLKTVTDAPLPKGANALPKGHTLVKVAYASLNHLDYKIAEAPLGSHLFRKPATAGVDFVGTVVATNLGTLKPGQRVLGRTEPPAFGTLADYVVVGKAGIAALPEDVPLKAAACVGICGVTALQSLAPHVGPGKKALIHGGSGGVGLFAIQVARALGCEDVTAVCSGANMELCTSLGATAVIDYQVNDILKSLTNRSPKYDVVLDTVFANADLYWRCHEFLVPGGKYVCVGLPSNVIKAVKTMLTIHLLPRFLGGGRRKFVFHPVSANPDHFIQVAEWIRDGTVKAVVSDEYDLDDAARAYAKLKTGRTRGKIIIEVGGDPELEI